MSNRIVVTGAAGFVGSNIVRGLNARGITDVIAVDNLTRGEKFRNLTNLEISDYIDKDVFYERFARGEYGQVEAVFHQGACSDTMQHDGRYMLDNNYRDSKTLLDKCLVTNTRLFYASSAATYGASPTFVEDPRFEQPLNVYGYSKLLFDEVVRRALASTKKQIVGFRYFNVYGPGEQHKGRMASVAHHHFNQFQEKGRVQLFGEYGGCGPGEHMRDFVFVDDVVAVNLWFFDHPDKRGVFNLGCGVAQPFNDVAQAVINGVRVSRGTSALSLEQMQEAGLIEYVEFPDALVGKYQCFTQANLENLRAAGCEHKFASVEKGVSAYVERLLRSSEAV